MTTAIVPGSLSAIAQKTNLSLAETFLSVDALVIVDTSGSMDSHDAAGGRRRYAVACDELQRLQATLPGKIGVISFSDTAIFCPGGVPTFLGSGTNLAGALKFVKAADDTGIQFIVISDGSPDDPDDALRQARKFKSKIDTVYVGPENGGGRAFLKELADASGGLHSNQKVEDIASTVQKLMLQSGGK